MRRISSLIVECRFDNSTHGGKPAKGEISVSDERPVAFRRPIGVRGALIVCMAIGVTGVASFRNPRAVHGADKQEAGTVSKSSPQPVPAEKTPPTRAELKARYKQLVLDREAESHELILMQDAFVEDVKAAVRDVFHEEIPWDPRVIIVRISEGRVEAELADPGADSDARQQLEKTLNSAKEFNNQIRDPKSSVYRRANARLDAHKKKLQNQEQLVDRLNSQYVEARASVTGKPLDAANKAAWLNEPHTAMLGMSLTRKELDEIRQMLDEELAAKYRKDLDELRAEQKKRDALRGEVDNNVKQLYDAMLFHRSPEDLRWAVLRLCSPFVKEMDDRSIGRMQPIEAQNARTKQADEDRRVQEVKKAFDRDLKVITSREAIMMEYASEESDVAFRYREQERQVRKIGHRCDIIKAILIP